MGGRVREFSLSPFGRVIVLPVLLLVGMFGATGAGAFDGAASAVARGPAMAPAPVVARASAAAVAAVASGSVVSDALASDSVVRAALVPASVVPASVAPDSDSVSDRGRRPLAPRPWAPPRPHVSTARAGAQAPEQQPVAATVGSRDPLPGSCLTAPPTATADSARPAPTPASLQVFRL